jgi:hypothetical protein
LEAAAIVWAIDKFKNPYLLDNEFDLVTDHAALKAFKTISGKSAKMERWSFKLQDVKFAVRHSPGVRIPHVDCLSRNIGNDRVTKVLEDSTFISYQRRDTDFKHLWNNYDKLCKDNPELLKREIEINPSFWHSFVVKPDGKMYHRIYADKYQKSNKFGTDRLVIPKRYRITIMRECHDKHHYSFKKCYRNMQKIVYCSNMYNDMKQYCDYCKKCQEGSPYTARTAGKLQKFPVYRKFV